jgi:dynein heavy chain
LPLNKKENETVFDYYIVIQDQKAEYTLVKPEIWKPSPDRPFKFSQLLLPTFDSFRVEFLGNSILTQPRPTHFSSAFVQNGVLLIGGSGTAKTSSVLMWAQKFDPTVQLFKRINFSSATSPGLFQASIDQVTLEIVRQLIEQGGFYWLDKAQRGSFKSIKNLSYVGAMNHPGGGRNDIPNRL